MIISLNQRIVALFAGALVHMGCSAGVQDRVLPFKPDPVGEAKAIVNAYVSGQGLGSESSAFDDLVARVAAVDGAKGAQLRAFFDATLQRGPDKARAKALLDAW